MRTFQQELMVLVLILVISFIRKEACYNFVSAKGLFSPAKHTQLPNFSALFVSVTIGSLNVQPTKV